MGSRLKGPVSAQRVMPLVKRASWILVVPVLACCVVVCCLLLRGGLRADDDIMTQAEASVLEAQQEEQPRLVHPADAIGLAAGGSEQPGGGGAQGFNPPSTRHCGHAGSSRSNKRWQLLLGLLKSGALCRRVWGIDA